MPMPHLMKVILNQFFEKNLKPTDYQGALNQQSNPY